MNKSCHNYTLKYDTIKVEKGATSAPYSADRTQEIIEPKMAAIVHGRPK